MQKDLTGKEQGLSGYWRLKPNSRYMLDDSAQGNHGLVKEYEDYFFKALTKSEPNVTRLDKFEVDIIVPIYNAFEYTKKCIESELRQGGVKIK